MEHGIGQPVRRKEDFRLLTGRGCYSDDVNLAGQAYAQFVRTPHAHARITAIDTAAASSSPGVLAVLTASDYLADGHLAIPHGAVPIDAIDPKKPAFVNLDGAAPFDAPNMPLADGKVRHVGEAVALVVAETAAEARDAAERVEVAYAPLPAVTTAVDAVEPDAPQLWDGAPKNLCVDAELGDEAATEAAFAEAAHVVRATLVNNRIVNAQMEPRAAVADYDAESGTHTLYAGSQGSHRLKMVMVGALQVPPEKVRVVARDVGGGFGPRTFLYPEFLLVTWAARRLGRPVKWQGDRSESFVTDVQGRDLVTHAELALDRDGRFLATRTTLYGNVGGNTISYVPLSNGPRLATSIYDMKAGYVRIHGVTTNTLPTGPFRGAGRPEAMFAIERLIDLAAEETGIDRVELRRRNLIAPAALPYASPMGMTYDSGAFAENMDMTLGLADWDGFQDRRAEAEARGKRLGIGVANYVEAPVGAPIEYTHVTVRPDRSVDVKVGTHSHGQGHETSFAQVITEWLGVPFEAVNLIFGDTEVVPKGGGTHSDRSMRMAGRVMVEASEAIIEKGRQAAAQLLEAASADIEFTAGQVHRRRHRPIDRHLRRRARAGRRRPPGGFRRYPRCRSRVFRPHSGAPQWLRGVRSRGRSRNRRRRSRSLRDGRRRRARDQSHDSAWSDPWGNRHGRGTGVAGKLRLRGGYGPAPYRLVHGLLPGACRRPAVLQSRAQRSANAGQHARRQGRRRRRDDAGACRGHQRRRRRA